MLVQGRASFDPKPDRVWLDSLTPQWERFLGPAADRAVGRWLRSTTTSGWRSRSRSTGSLAGRPRMRRRAGRLRRPLPATAPRPQAAPKKGTTARVPTEKLRARQSGSPTRCWAGSAPTACPRSSRPGHPRRRARRRPRVGRRGGSRRAVAAPGSPRTCSSPGWSARSSASTPAGSTATAPGPLLTPHQGRLRAARVEGTVRRGRRHRHAHAGCAGRGPPGWPGARAPSRR